MDVADDASTTITAANGLAVTAPVLAKFQALPPTPGPAPAELFTLRINVTAGVEVSVVPAKSGGQSLAGNVTKASLVADVASSKVGTVKMLPELVTFLNVVLQLTVPVVNKVLGAGVYPLPSSSRVTPSNTAVAFRDGYLVASSDITINI